MKSILGIDVGGTKIAAGLVDNHFRVKDVKTIDTSHTDLLGQLIRLIESYSGFAGIGLGMPGPVLPNGKIPRLTNIKSFKAINLNTLLARRFKIPVHIMNDAKAFALAEARLGAGKGFATVVGVTLGTGIGSGLVRAGQIYYGSSRVAGELGGILINDKETLEQWMQGLMKLRNAAQDQALIQRVLSVVIPTLDPQVVVLGGGRMDHPGMQKVIDQSLKSIFNYPVKTIVKVSKLKHAGIIGSALPLLKK